MGFLLTALLAIFIVCLAFKFGWLALKIIFWCALLIVTFPWGLIVWLIYKLATK